MLKSFYFTNTLFIIFAVIVTVTGTFMQKSWFMLLFQLQFGQKCNFLTVDGSINLRFDVSVTVTPLGPLQSDFFYCKKTSYRLGRQTRRKGNGIDYFLKTRRIRLSNVSQRDLARRSEKVNKPQLAQWG